MSKESQGDMRKMIPTMTLAAAAALLPLAACDRGASQAEQPGKNAAAAADAQRDTQARLVAMAEGERNAVFIRAIRDAGFDCQHVDSSSYQGVLGGQGGSAGQGRAAGQGGATGTPTWVATCDKASNWVILIGGNGAAQVIKGSDIEAARDRAGAGQSQAGR